MFARLKHVDNSIWWMLLAQALLLLFAAALPFFMTATLKNFVLVTCGGFS